MHKCYDLAELMRLSPVLAAAVKQKQPAYSLDFVHTIGLVQEGVTVEKDKDVIERLEQLKIPEQFRQYTGPLYRAVGLKAELIAELYEGKSYQYKNISYWTKSLRYAKGFIRHEYFQRYNSPKDRIAVVLGKTFQPSSVILDSDKLRKDSQFKKSVKYWREQGELDMLLMMEPDQQEVICKPFTLVRSDIKLMWHLKMQKWILPPESLTLQDMRTKWLGIIEYEPLKKGKIKIGV